MKERIVGTILLYLDEGETYIQCSVCGDIASYYLIQLLKDGGMGEEIGLCQEHADIVSNNIQEPPC